MKKTGLICAFILLLVGCTTNWPHRTYLPPELATGNTNRPAGLPPIDPVTNSVLEYHTNFNLGYVEFDDQGWFWSHNAWVAVRTEIKNEALAATNGFTILVFVHGWKNSADYDNDNVQMFRGVLTNLALTIEPRKVFGLYVGWRGLSTKWDWFPPAGEELSFYQRKEVAERIGHQGPATQVFTELETMQDKLNEQNQSNGLPRTELVIVGHSFGGDLVYSSISQILTERLVTASRRHDQIKSFGDLVVLVNPAFEASLYKNLFSLAISPDINYSADQKPVLAIFESKSDGPNGFWFPKGRSLNTWYEKTRPSQGTNEIWIYNLPKDETPNERYAINHSVGFDDDFITYDLNYTTNYSKTSSELAATSGRSKLNPYIQSEQNALASNNVAPSASAMVPIIFPSTNYACVLQPRPNEHLFKAGNPFIDVAVDPAIINGHSDINNPNFLNFLRDFIIFSQTNAPNVNTNYQIANPK